MWCWYRLLVFGFGFGADIGLSFVVLVLVFFWFWIWIGLFVVPTTASWFAGRGDSFLLVFMNQSRSSAAVNATLEGKTCMVY